MVSLNASPHDQWAAEGYPDDDARDCDCPSCGGEGCAQETGNVEDAGWVFYGTEDYALYCLACGYGEGDVTPWTDNADEIAAAKALA